MTFREYEPIAERSVLAAYFDGTTRSAHEITAASGGQVFLDLLNPNPDMPRLVIPRQNKRVVVYAGYWIVDQDGEWDALSSPEFAQRYRDKTPAASG